MTDEERLVARARSHLMSGAPPRIVRIFLQQEAGFDDDEADAVMKALIKRHKQSCRIQSVQELAKGLLIAVIGGFLTGGVALYSGLLFGLIVFPVILTLYGTWITISALVDIA